MRILKVKRMRKIIKIINETLPMFIYTSLVSLKRRMWKNRLSHLPKFQHILDDWRVSYTLKRGVFCPYSKCNGALLGGKNSAEEDANLFRATVGKFGDRAGVRACVGDRKAAEVGREVGMGVTHRQQWGSQEGPRLSCQRWSWRWALLWVTSAALPSTAQGVLVSPCHKHQGGKSFSVGFENFFQTPCHHSLAFTVAVLEMRRWKIAEKAKKWKLLNWGNT